MIENDSIGSELTSPFKSHFASKVLNVDRGPKEQIIFARKHETVWHQRDVTSMFFQASPISKQIADNYGTSGGTEVEIVFDNTPFPRYLSYRRYRWFNQFCCCVSTLHNTDRRINTSAAR